jgi:ABC-type phosphate transport system permease subunit
LQVMGGGNLIHTSLFGTGSTLASRIAEEAIGAPFALQLSSLFYLGAILLAFELGANLAAQLIIGRFNTHSAVAAR